MEADRWTRLKELFNEARALPVSERDAYLSDKCGDDMPLREELHKLLAADEEAAHHLEEIRQGLPLSNLVGKEENQLQGDPHRLIGRTLAARYRVQQWLGGGGMGVVYRARDLQFDRPVALKFLPRELSRDPEAIRRFQEEARAAGVLSHANVCTIHEIGKADDGQLFIVMAYCDGETLKKKIAR
jgi:DNA-directed RNA polymerase subunit F